MGTKAQLPDATKLAMDNDGLTITLFDGHNLSLKGDKEVRTKAVSSPSGLRDALFEIMDKHAGALDTYRLEDYVA
ncbi:hypothetical protein [Pseudodesulfovibrio sp.]|uniref:hypothetical protein n=1 Tax=Pseudodesulfovibrio sp. TaxID=2035812 RepID=UPI00260721D4|nr:hypothetical protein [Pseudodesulfovibrio sp.]MDD3311099.1 hypothetical protein [Pseudodesulfovibrio sp.]